MNIFIFWGIYSYHSLSLVVSSTRGKLITFIWYNIFFPHWLTVSSSLVSTNVSLRLASLVLTYSICYKFLFLVDYLCFFPCLRPVLKYRHPSPLFLPSRLSLLDVSLLLIILILSWYPTTSSLKNSVFIRNSAFVFGSGIYPCFDLLKDHYIILWRIIWS